MLMVGICGERGAHIGEVRKTWGGIKNTPPKPCKAKKRGWISQELHKGPGSRNFEIGRAGQVG